MAGLPSGIVTLLLTDVEGSTRQWLLAPDRMRANLETHDRLLAEAIAAAGGTVIKSRGEGDSCFAVFPLASEAVAAACSAQLLLRGQELKVRMAVHTGETSQRDADYYGPTVNLSARLRSIAHGGQIVISQAAMDQVRDNLPPGATVRDLGDHRLKDIDQAEHVYQLVHPDLPSSFPALLSETPSHNLPARRRALIGREGAITRAADLLQRGEVAALTLVGPGGSGKTSLAVEVGSVLVDDYSDGVWFVPLASVSDSLEVSDTIAHAVGVTEVPGKPLQESLHAYLAKRKALLILDNFEQVMPAAEQVSELLRRCPQVKALVTSREALRIAGEQSMDVPPLTSSASVELFAARAAESREGFEVNEENRLPIEVICRRLDRLPLAIELAAARSRVLSPQEIADRLDRTLQLLTTGARDLPERQRTLAATIAWSYDLLEPHEQKLFRVLGVFRGGWTFRAAEEVCADDGLDVLDGLDSLAAKSLVRREDADGRFTMLETIREYALDRLREADEMVPTRQRHASFYLQRASADAALALTRHEREALARFRADLDNFRAALEFLSADASRLDDFRTLLARLAPYFYFGLISEGLRWAELAAAGKGGQDRPRAEAARALGTLRLVSGAVREARGPYDEAIVFARSAGDLPMLTRVLLSRAMVALDEPLLARALLDEALANAVALGDPELLGSVRLGIARSEGDLDALLVEYVATLARAREDGADLRIAFNLNKAGHLYLQRGDREKAEAMLTEAVTVSQANGDARLVACCLADFVGLASGTDAALGARLSGAVDHIFGSLDVPMEPTQASEYKLNVEAIRSNLTSADFDSHHAEGARLTVDEALDLYLASSKARPPSSTQ